MRYREGMSYDPAQLPRDLKAPAMEPGQPPSPSACVRQEDEPGEIVGYLIDGKLYHPADVLIVRGAP